MLRITIPMINFTNAQNLLNISSCGSDNTRLKDMFECSTFDVTDHVSD